MRSVEGPNEMYKVTNSKDFFTSIVKKDYDEFFGNPLDLRLAIHAAFSAFHMADWYYADNQERCDRVFNMKKFVAFKKKLIEEFPPFKILQDIANAYKHFEITKYDPVTSRTSPLGSEILPCPEILCSGADFAMGEPGTAIVVKMNSELGEYNELFKNVIRRVVHLWEFLNENPLKTITTGIDTIKDRFHR